MLAVPERLHETCETDGILYRKSRMDGMFSIKGLYLVVKNKCQVLSILLGELITENFFLFWLLRPQTINMPSFVVVFFSLCLVEGKCLWCYKNTFCVIKSFAPCDILRNFTRWPQHVRSLANIRDFKERLRTVLVRWPEVIFFHHSSTDTTTAIAVKTSVKSVFAFFLFFIVIIPTRLLCQMFANGWSRAVSLHGKEM